ncbi:CoA biosynthesis protein CoaBC [Pseudothauera nasutitermitis]|uniref:CoA biosynthesis protein CoaBC n=1 Tax=Pseudothauera nasutitermitis TaxID=2565930 RepID=A0A4S4B0P2_9RHOO|nr:CoA biosynthesis protein CoaBC [Pseudothauera nasutitermitis]THF65592.1 CoA biosynthesis protein CoaBC [Pseudothauera nasutitermitis]
MSKAIYQVSEETTLDDLYDLLEKAIALVESHSGIVHRRARPSVEAAIKDFRRFREGELDTDLGSKRWFKALAKLAEEVGDMSPEQSAYVLAVAEVAHAAAHLGHLNTAMSRGDRTEADRRYVVLQRAYVNFGLQGVKEFIGLVAPDGLAGHPAGAGKGLA